MLIENIMGSTSKIKILRLFFEYPNRTFTTKEILDELKIGYGYGLKCLKLLSNAGILKMKKVGKQKRYFLNENHVLFPILNKLFEEEKKKFSNISLFHKSVIAEMIEKLADETVILFGSVAAGTATPRSDIDILVVTKKNEKEIRKKVKIIAQKNDVEVQAIILSEEKLKEMIKKKARIIMNIAKEKIFLIGNKKILEEIENV